MTATDQRQFQAGDRVRVRGKSGTWIVVADDTNRTPVRDPEPAYRLTRRKRGGQAVRYARESDLLLALPADTASLAD